MMSGVFILMLLALFWLFQFDNLLYSPIYICIFRIQLNAVLRSQMQNWEHFLVTYNVKGIPIVTVRFSVAIKLSESNNHIADMSIEKHDEIMFWLYVLCLDISLFFRIISRKLNQPKPTTCIWGTQD